MGEDQSTNELESRTKQIRQSVTRRGATTKPWGYDSLTQRCSLSVFKTPTTGDETIEIGEGTMRLVSSSPLPYTTTN